MLYGYLTWGYHSASCSPIVKSKKMTDQFHPMRLKPLRSLGSSKLSRRNLFRVSKWQSLCSALEVQLSEQTCPDWKYSNFTARFIWSLYALSTLQQTRCFYKDNYCCIYDTCCPDDLLLIFSRVLPWNCVTCHWPIAVWFTGSVTSVPEIHSD